MFGREIENEWNIVEWEPMTYGGYRKQTTTVTNFHDRRPPEVDNYSWDFEQQQSDGSLYAYRLSPFDYPKLRANGVSPVCLLDVVSYDYQSRMLLTYSSGLVNTIKSDSIMTGVVVLRSEANRVEDPSLPPPPNDWNHFRSWSASIPSRNIVIETEIWATVSKALPLQGSKNRVTIKEMEAPWKMIQGYHFEDSFLTLVDISSPSGKSVRLKGITCGRPESRLKAVLKFVESVAIAIDIS